MPLISFKTELKLNNQQKTMMAKHAGVARHAYNWGFATCLKALENNEKLPTSIDLHKKVKQIRIDSIHKLTSWLAKNHSEIVIENLNVSGMLKNHRLASAIADCGFYEFKRQLEYKTRWYGSKLIIADRFYRSSQLCSNCQNRQKMPLNKRVYECSHCGLKIDRDLNASINLELYPTTCSEHSRTTDSSSGSKACEELNQLSSKSIKDSLKQEVNIHPMKSGDLS